MAAAADHPLLPPAQAGRHRVTIVGGGFGGLYVAKALAHADAEVTCSTG
jgi:cation diffusion facilitator CzcD-associated flavoprotein CzcO